VPVTEGDLDALFDAARPRAEAIGARYERQRPLRVATGACGCLPTVAVAVAVFSQWANRFDGTRFYTAAGALVAAGLVVGGLLFRRLAHADAPIHDQADRELVLPLAARLVEGAAVTHPTLTPADWAPARLLPETFGHPWQCTRLAGRIAGLTAVLDEVEIIFTAHGEEASWKFDGWIVRLALPFAVGGHVRVRKPLADGHEDRELRRAFTRCPAPADRLGGTRTVEVAPPGSTYAGVARPGEVAPEALVTDELLALLREDEALQLAACASDLWIVLERRGDAFKGAYRTSFERDVWHAAARALALVERVVRAVAAAGRR
jgi:hypothetical protein